MKRKYGYNLSKNLLWTIERETREIIEQCYNNIINGLEEQAKINYNTLKHFYKICKLYKIDLKEKISELYEIETNFGFINTPVPPKG